MNYRHHYHAGIFADIYKHLILLNLLQYIQKKDTPIFILDTHAGIGLYDLTLPPAEKTKEYETGFSKILIAENPTPLAHSFIELIKNLPQNRSLTSPHYYPGSPLIAYELLRPQDRLVLSELHPEDYLTLKNVFKHDKRVQAHLMDSYHALSAFTPPKENRGLVLIDPSYEKTDEYEKIEIALKKALQKWPNGMYAIWYPIKKEQSIPASFIDHIQPLCKTLLKKEFLAYDKDSPIGLNGCGMLLINPPWDFEQTFGPTEQWLNQVLKA